MQKPLNACDGQSADRDKVAHDLYITNGATSASHRYAVNSSLGDFDLTAYVVGLLGLKPGMNVADIGCGSGGHLQYFKPAVEPGGKAVGFDISADAVAAAKAKGLTADVGDAASIALDSGTMDGLSCNFAIYYHPRLNDVLNEFKRVMRPGGTVVITGPGTGTNAMLYDFNEQATGHGASDADLMGVGYVEGPVFEAAKGIFKDCRFEMQTNNIRFPDGPTFLEYWTATSLFQRTPGATLEAGQKLLEGKEGPLVLVKKIATVIATA